MPGGGELPARAAHAEPDGGIQLLTPAWTVIWPPLAEALPVVLE